MLSGKIEEDVSVVGDPTQDPDDPLPEVPVQRHVDGHLGRVGQRVDGHAFVYRPDKAESI